MDEPGDERRPAEWSTRVGAWLIDVLVLGAVVAVLGDLFGLGPGVLAVNPLDVGRHTLVLFAYWTLFESKTGQSPGKLALDIAVVDEAGHPPGLAASAVQSFGKAFLLPLDLLIGLVAMPEEGQRLFNRLSGTRVVELPEDEAGGGRATAVDA